VSQLKDLASRLSKLGYRMTPQRLMILSAIEDSDTHISAEEIYAQVTTQYPQINISTVYRTLELLKQLGLVTETDLGDGLVRYHSAEKGHHHHLVCTMCGSVTDLDEEVVSPLQEVILRKYQFIPDLRHLVIFGRCVSCRE